MPPEHVGPVRLGAPYRVLVVDDDPAHRGLEREVLSGAAYHVLEADSGMGALGMLEQQPVDAILLDKRMPGMDGDEVCRRIRGELGLKFLPILMVSGNNDADTLAMSLAAGASDFLRKPYDPLELLARVDAAVAHKRMTDQLDSAETVLFALARMVEAKDGTTGDHCSRLSHTGVMLGRELGLGPEDLLALRRGGVLHDIGKLGIPDSILLKRGALTEAEWTVMRSHVEIGASLVGSLRSMRQTVPIVLHHHERWDGSGYPHGLRGQEIPLVARVFQIVDIYDALAHARPYKPALGWEQIIEIMQNEADRGWRDPELTAVFLDILRHRSHLLRGERVDSDDLGSKVSDAICVHTALSH